MTLGMDKQDGSPTIGQQVELLTTGEVNHKLGGLIVSAALLVELGIKPVPQKGSGTYFRASDFPLIVEALIAHLLKRA